MGLNQHTLAQLSKHLAGEDVRRIEDNARIAEALERRWLERADRLFGEINRRVLDVLEQTGELPDSWAWLQHELGGFLLEHELMATETAARTITPAEYARMRLPKWPTKTERIRALWDRWRKTGALPGRTREQAAAIKVLYIRRVQFMWQNYGRQFIQGRPRVIDKDGRDVNRVNRDRTDKRGNVWNPDAFNREGAARAIEAEAKVSRARARTIVETETTRYYNDTRTTYYSSVESVIGYLFVAVRDHATTKWCRSRNGVVFIKGTDTLKKNTPPCHYNCRSELLPLSRLNPTHRKLLEDASRRAENNNLVPLMPHWNA